MYTMSLFLIEGLQMYGEQCIAEGVVTPEEVKAMYDSYQQICNDAHAESLLEKSIKVLIMHLL